MTTFVQGGSKAYVGLYGVPRLLPYHDTRDIFLRCVCLCVPVSLGVYDECDSDVDVLYWARHNVFLLYHMGVFTALLELLNMEIE